MGTGSVAAPGGAHLNHFMTHFVSIECELRRKGSAEKRGSHIIACSCCDIRAFYGASDLMIL